MSEPSAWDVVIVGGGPGGLAAAITAADSGLSVVLVEKTGRLGGQLHTSAGRMSAAGTRRQRAAGIDDDPDSHFDDIMRIGRGMADPVLLRRAVEAAPGAVDWLDDLGFPFAPGSPSIVTYHEPYSHPRTHWGESGASPAGNAILDVLVGPGHLDGVEIRLRTSMTRLLGEAEGTGLRCTGIVVEGADGQETLEASTVILATGGYGASRAMIEHIHPDHPESLSACQDHATGDGHAALADLGVPIEGAHAYQPSLGLIVDPVNPGRALPLPEAQVITDPAERLPWEIWVNADGERFVAEDHPSPAVREDALLAQPGQEMLVIWDDTAVREAPSVVRGSLVSTTGGLPVAPWHISAGSIDELAFRCGLPLERLTATIDRYNEVEPDSLGRAHRPARIDTAPFHAVRCRGGMLVSWAGPRVDHQLRPLDAEGRPIQGIRVVGELLGMGRLCGNVLGGGMGVTPAIALGRSVVHELRPGL